ncbi:hypothetical protein HXX76_012551 [Chlamydomonas incerta]|uniref:FAD synthase n=1 Tax=Chlamydomonas incerta TaxID=51695 RepID=A0A835SHL7_CHLIN|nr:hypothetical protein HXX76_012551 [Chlamydomonas incerta]|eukprot:KAG2427357.1 hypothetical protein HXX76_012551 [Chlamydomonas incerta]
MEQCSTSSGRRKRSAQAAPRDAAGSSGLVAEQQVAAGPAAAAAAAAASGGQAVLVEDTTQETWRTPLRRAGCVVALGKFDALHRGHQALADAAADLCAQVERDQQEQQAQADASASTSGGCGEVVLLSFSGMGAVLGWPDRQPLTAPQDRGRVLAGWAEALRSGARGGPAANGASAGPASNGNGCGAGRVVRLRTMPFGQIRGMSPEEFVALLARDLGAAGVVAGRNYRFGFKAAGDADALVRLGAAHGLRVSIVDLVSLAAAADGDGSSSDPAPASASASASAAAAGLGEPEATMEEGRTGASSASGAGASSSSGSREGNDVAADGARVSSSRIRSLLEGGHVEAVETLLGRKYRLVCDLADVAAAAAAAGAGDGAASALGTGLLRVPAACYRNQAPAPGLYRVLVRLVDSGPPGAEIAAEAASFMRTSLSRTSDPDPDPGSGLGVGVAEPFVGPVCAPVRISEEGLEVDLGPAGVHSSDSPPPARPLLLLDFDACG